MSSILDTSSIYNTYSQTASNAISSTLQSSLSNVNNDSSKDELMEVCKDFESYFVQKIIEAAKSTIADEDEEDKGEYMQYFGDILNQQYADTITENGGIGLAQQLYDSMKNTYNIEERKRRKKGHCFAVAFFI